MRGEDDDRRARSGSIRFKSRAHPAWTTGPTIDDYPAYNPRVMEEGDLYNPATAMPPALRERLSNAVKQALAEATAEPKLAGAAYYFLGQLALASGDRDAAVQDLQAAVAAQDGEFIYKAAMHLLGMHESLAPRAPREGGYTPPAEIGELARYRAVIGLHGGVKSHFTSEIHAWFRASKPLLFHAHPNAILAWLHSRPGHTLAVPALERFYAAAVEMGYCTSNPMPQVRQSLGLASSPSPSMRGPKTQQKYAPHLA
jgi:hypothetical protein